MAQALQVQTRADLPLEVKITNTVRELERLQDQAIRIHGSILSQETAERIKALGSSMQDAGNRLWDIGMAIDERLMEDF